MIRYIIDDTPGVNKQQLFVIEGGGRPHVIEDRKRDRRGKVGAFSYTAIPRRGIDEEGYRRWRRFITTLLLLLN